MHPDYARWIADYVASQKGSVRGMCQGACKAMSAAFTPGELTPVAGFASVTDEGGWETEHWWCVTADGEIVDPTAAQFPPGPIAYRAWKPGDEVHVGKCMNCGWEIYGRPPALGAACTRKQLSEGAVDMCCCSEECYAELVAAYG